MAGSRYYLFDGVGNARLLLNAAGQVIGDCAYTAWGTRLSPAYLDSPFGFKGQWGAYRDAETGLLLMGARTYSPAIGRFLSRDPSGYAAGPNLYGFCGGDPVNFFDRTGRFPCVEDGPFWGAVRWTSDFLGDDAPPLRAHFRGKDYGPEPGRGKSIFGALIDAHDSAITDGLTEGNTCASPQQVLEARIGFARAFGAAVIQSSCAASGAMERSESPYSGGLVAFNARARVPVDNVTWPGTMSIDEALGEGIGWVGNGYREPGGRSGVPSGGVFRSSDGLRQFRMQDSDIDGLHGNIGPHVHFQTFDAFGNEVENIHVPIR